MTPQEAHKLGQRFGLTVEIEGASYRFIRRKLFDEETYWYVVIDLNTSTDSAKEIFQNCQWLQGHASKVTSFNNQIREAYRELDRLESEQDALRERINTLFEARRKLTSE